MNKKTLLINIDYVDDTGKFWIDSVKNLKATLKDNQSIHELIADIIENESYCEMSYKWKPQTNIYRDIKDGETKTIGYIYRVKTDIEGKQAKFDAWVEIQEIIDYKIINIDK